MTFTDIGFVHWVDTWPQYRWSLT